MIQKETTKTNRLITSKDFNRFYIFKRVKQPIKCSNPTMRKILFRDIELFIYIKHLIKIHNLDKAHKIKNYNDKVMRELQEYNEMKKNHFLMLKETERIMKAIKQKQYRLFKKVNAIISNNADSCLFFATLTFQDKVFNRMNETTRKKTITRLLKKYATEYIGNIDYGTLKQREHYHFIIKTDTYETLDKLRQEYNQVFNSAMNYENIVVYNSKAIAKYIGKLTNHALKESTNVFNQYYSHLIYSRDIRHEISINE